MILELLQKSNMFLVNDIPSKEQMFMSNPHRSALVDARLALAHLWNAEAVRITNEELGAIETQ